jgi:hypothetical protein
MTIGSAPFRCVILSNRRAIRPVATDRHRLENQDRQIVGRRRKGGQSGGSEALRIRSVDRESRSTQMAEENLGGRLNEGEEYEEITSDEVDRVVEQLERLMETVSSENIKTYLEDAVNNIFFLLYDDEDCADAA